MRGRPRRRRFSVSLKIGFSLLLVTLIAAVALGIQEAFQAKSRVIDGYVSSAHDMSTSVLTQYEAALSQGNKATTTQGTGVDSAMQGYLGDLLMTHDGLLRVRLLRAAPSSVWMSSNQADVTYKPARSDFISNGSRWFYTTLDGLRVLEVVVPRWLPRPASVSAMALYYSLDAQNKAVRDAIRNVAIGTAAVVALELLVLFPIFELLVLRRVRRLGRAASAVAAGELSMHLPEGDERPGRDELVNVAREFDSMVRTIEKKTRQQEAVTVLGQHALEGLSLSDLFQEATALVSEHMGAEYSAVMELIEGDLLVMRVGVGWEGEGTGAPTGEAEHYPQAEFTLRSFVPVVVEDFETETRFGRSALQLERGVVSSATVVIPGQAHPFGILSADSCERHSFSEDEVNFLQFVAGVLAGWIERRQAEEQVTFMAYHDKLTGLPNRAMLEEHLALALARAERSDLACAVLFMDLDNFKVVNDTMGHAAGDELLRQMSGRLREATRDVDLVARQGGDEFLVLLADLEKGSGSDEEARSKAEAVAVSVARRIQEDLAPPFPIGDSEFVSSASIGVSVYPFDARDVSTLLKNADAAMYRSKSAGHGLFCMHGTESPQR